MPVKIPNGRMGARLYKESATPKLTIEVFLDYCCPFSAKMFATLYDEVLPPAGSECDVELVVQNVPQPWHPQSAIMHEVALAVKKVHEPLFFKASAALFAKQEEFFDRGSFDKSREYLYSELITVVAEACSDDNFDEDAVMAELTIPQSGSANAGNGVTDLMKFAAKYHRVRGIHTTPTVLLNDVEAPDVESKWTAKQWFTKISTCTGDTWPPEKASKKNKKNKKQKTQHKADEEDDDKEEAAVAKKTSAPPKTQVVTAEKASSFVGRKVKKWFDTQYYEGEVTKVDEFFIVTYDDGDKEDMTLDELVDIILPAPAPGEDKGAKSGKRKK